MATTTDFASFASAFKTTIDEQRGAEDVAPKRVRHLGLMGATCDEAAKRLAKAKDAAGAKKILADLHGEYLKAPLVNESDDSARSEPLGPIANAIHNDDVE